MITIKQRPAPRWTAVLLLWTALCSLFLPAGQHHGGSRAPITLHLRQMRACFGSEADLRLQFPSSMKTSRPAINLASASVIAPMPTPLLPPPTSNHRTSSTRPLLSSKRECLLETFSRLSHPARMLSSLLPWPSWSPVSPG